jgi:hypothetical protein
MGIFIPHSLDSVREILSKYDSCIHVHTNLPVKLKTNLNETKRKLQLKQGEKKKVTACNLNCYLYAKLLFLNAHIPSSKFSNIIGTKMFHF